MIGLAVAHLRDWVVHKTLATPVRIASIQILAQAAKAPAGRGVAALAPQQVTHALVAAACMQRVTQAPSDTQRDWRQQLYAAEQA